MDSSRAAAMPRAPAAKPDFTVKALRAVVPPHCFERPLHKAFGYLLRDVVVVALLYCASTWFNHPSVPKLLAWLVLWPAYWFLQGAFCTGVWVIAHECGHGAFSAFSWLNDVVGFVLHSLLLVPYFSWKHSHRRHHHNTGSLDKDEVFCPVPMPMDAPRDSTFTRIWKLIGTLTVGWPAYLLFNLSGRQYDRWANHFDPYSPIFTKRERFEVILSDLGLVFVACCLIKLGMTFGWLWLLRSYFVPYFVVNFWLVMITLLQHTHPSLPHFDANEWAWLRGALSTVDRSYGFILNNVFHHITDTHVAHHIFSQIPHYHAAEATKHLSMALGPYYIRDGRNCFKALWEDFCSCHFVAPDENGKGVYWYRF